MKILSLILLILILSFFFFLFTQTIVAIVPDLIVIADSDTGHGIFVEELRFGQCVTVLVQPCNPLLSSSVALKRVGPASFGLGDEVEFKSCGVYVPPVPLPMYFANGGGSSGSRGV